MKSFLLTRLATVKNSLAVVVFAASAVLSSNVEAAFIGAYDVANWTSSPGTGVIDTSGAPNSIVFTSGNNLSASPSDTDFTVQAAADGFVSFQWSFSTADFPSSDPFGYLLNGAFFQLVNGVGAATQAGNAFFAVALGDTFGFRAHTLDNKEGASVTTVSNFNVSAGAAPAPRAIILLIAGLVVWRFSELIAKNQRIV